MENLEQKVVKNDYYFRHKRSEVYKRCIREVAENPPTPTDVFFVLDKEGRYVYWAIDEVYKKKEIKTPFTFCLDTGTLHETLVHVFVSYLLENPKSNLLKNLKVKVFDPMKSEGYSYNRTFTDETDHITKDLPCIWYYYRKDVGRDSDTGRWYNLIGVVYRIGKEEKILKKKTFDPDPPSDEEMREIIFGDFLPELSEIIQQHYGKPYHLEEDEIYALLENIIQNGSFPSLKSVLSVEILKRKGEFRTFKNLLDACRHLATMPEIKDRVREKLESLMGIYGKEFIDSVRNMIKKKGKITITMIDGSINSTTQSKSTDLFLKVLFGEGALDTYLYLPGYYLDAEGERTREMTKFDPNVKPPSSGDKFLWGCVDYGNFPKLALTYRGMELLAPNAWYEGGYAWRDGADFFPMKADHETHERVTREVFREYIEDYMKAQK
jgi:hypothetical protein